MRAPGSAHNPGKGLRRNLGLGPRVLRALHDPARSPVPRPTPRPPIGPERAASAHFVQPWLGVAFSRQNSYDVHISIAFLPVQTASPPCETENNFISDDNISGATGAATFLHAYGSRQRVITTSLDRNALFKFSVTAARGGTTRPGHGMCHKGSSGTTVPQTPLVQWGSPAGANAGIRPGRLRSWPSWSHAFAFASSSPPARLTPVWGCPRAPKLPSEAHKSPSRGACP